MSWRKLALLMLLGFAALSWARSAPPPNDMRPILTLTPIEAGPRAFGPFAIQGAWQMQSPNSLFGSYSALLTQPDGTLLLASDSGRVLRFDPAQRGKAPLFAPLMGLDTTTKTQVDVEAMTRNPDGSAIWLAYEGTNAIERRNANLANPVTVRPDRMQALGSNQGAEAFVRLQDGRFLALSEGPRSRFGDVHTGFVFDGDPVNGAKASRFAFTTGEGYRPVDMAQLPDGRVLILTRKIDWGLPPRFRSRIMVADPEGLKEDSDWHGVVLGELARPLPSDNFEGMDIAVRPDGTVTIWLVSDDNRISFQRSLLLKLHWDPARSRPLGPDPVAVKKGVAQTGASPAAGTKKARD